MAITGSIEKYNHHPADLYEMIVKIEDKIEAAGKKSIKIFSGISLSQILILGAIGALSYFNYQLNQELDKLTQEISIVDQKVEDRSEKHYFKYTLSGDYWPHKQGGEFGHYMNFNQKIHGGVTLSNGAFTCTKDGTYQFGLYLIGDFLRNERAIFYFRKNGSTFQYLYVTDGGTGGNVRDFGGYYSYYAESTVKLEAGDTVKVYYSGTSGGNEEIKIFGSFSFFEGKFLF